VGAAVLPVRLDAVDLEPTPVDDAAAPSRVFVALTHS
jgi:hypothetical protein